MNHLHFVQSLEALQGGGLGTAALQMHQTLASRGESAIAATRSNTFDREWQGCVQGVRKGIPAFYYSPELAEHASSLVQAADWIHGHGLYVYPNYLFGGEARKQRKPLVCHVHGFFDPWILNRSKLKKRVVGMLFENRNLRNARFLRALTEKENRQIRATGLKNPVVVIPNGVDLAEVDASLEPIGEGVHFTRKRPRRVLFLSRLHPKKGLDMLIPAWARLSSEFPDWELAIVGPDEGGYQATIEALIREHHVDSSCSVFPAVFGSLKHDVFRTADLFVLPSYSEGFPMAVLEALAHRIPSVVTTECNVPEMAENGAVWECLPQPSEIGKTLRIALRADEAERSQRATIGRRMLEERYTWERVADSLEDACRIHQ